MGLYPEDGKILNPEEEDILKWCSAALYAGGADTVSSDNAVSNRFSDNL